MARWYGYNAPFIGGNQNILSQQVDEKLIKNDILQRILTNPGERVGRPDFGTGLRAFVFEGMYDQNIEELERDIRESVEDDGRISVKYLGLEPNKDNQSLAIKLVVQLLENPDTEFTIEAVLNVWGLIWVLI